MDKYIQAIKVRLIEYKLRRKMKIRLKEAEEILKIKLLPWQRDFVLKKTNIITVNERACGVSLCCALRFIIWADPRLNLYVPYSDSLIGNITQDPDWNKNPSWHITNLWELRYELDEGGMDVFPMAYTMESNRSLISISKLMSIDIILPE